MNPDLSALALSGAKQVIWTDGAFIPGSGAPVPLRLWRRAKRRPQNIDGMMIGVFVTQVIIHVDRADLTAEPVTDDSFTLEGPYGLEQWRVCERAAGETFMGNQVWRVPVEPVPDTAATIFMDGNGYE
jgi:hypothetical protein